MASSGNGIKIPFYLGLNEAFDEANQMVGPLMGKLKSSIERDMPTIKLAVDAKGTEKDLSEITKLNGQKKAELNQLKTAYADIQRRFREIAKSPAVDNAQYEQLKKLSEAWNQVSYAYESYKNQKAMLAAGGDEAALAEAQQAQQTTEALYGQARSLDALQAKMQAWKSALSQASVGSEEFMRAKIEVDKVGAAIESATLSLKNFGVADSSISGVTQRMAALETEYAKLSEAERKGTAGKAMEQEYNTLTMYSEKHLKTLREINAERGKKSVASDSIEGITQQMRDLEAEYAKLSEAERTGAAGKSIEKKYAFLSEYAETYLTTLRQINAESKKKSVASDSIEAVTQQMRDLEAAYAKLSEVDRKGAVGKGMIQDYRILAEYSEQYLKTLREIDAQSQQSRTATDSIAAVSRQMQELEATYARLSKAERNSAAGQEIINKYNALAAYSKKHLKTLKEINIEYTKPVVPVSSIEGITRQLRDLEQEYARLSDAARDGFVGQGIISNYKKLTDYANKHLKTLQQIHAEEMRTTLNGQIEQYKTLARSAEGIKLQMSTLSSTDPKFRALQSRLGAIQATMRSVEASIKEMGGTVPAAVDSSARSVERLNTQLKQSDSYLGRTLIRMAAWTAAFKVFEMIRSVREVTAEFEMQEVALGSIIQDTAKASYLFEKIKAAAIRSPFEIKDMVTYTKQLSAYRIESDKLYGTMMQLADVSSGLGVDMNRLILAYGQVRAASVLRGQELRQFTEAGIPLVEMLADKFSRLRGEMVSTGEVFQLISERAVPFSMVAEVFDDMTSAGGTFYKMQEKQAETLLGQWNNLKDSASIMYDEIGNTDSVSSAMGLMIKMLSNAAQHWRGITTDVQAALWALLAYKVAMSAVNAQRAVEKVTTESLAKAMSAENIQLSKKILQTKVGAWITRQYAAAQMTAATSTNLFTRALYKLWAAMLSNPVGAIIGVLVGLFVVIRKIASSTEDAEERIKNFNDAVNALEGIKEQAPKIDALVEEFRMLNEVLDKDEQTTKRLTKVQQILFSMYPQAFKDAKDYKEAIGNITQARIAEKEAAKKAITDMQSADSKYQKDQIEAQKKLDRLMKKQKSQSVIINEDGNLSMMGVAKDRISKKIKKQIGLLNDYRQAAIAADEALSDSKHQDTRKFDGWRAAIADVTKETEDFTGKIKQIAVYSDEQIQNFGSLFEALSDAKKNYDDYGKQVEAVEKAIVAAKGTELEVSLLANQKQLVAWRAAYQEILDKFDAWSLFDTKKEKKTSTGKSATDMYTEQISAQKTFLKDFQKGVEELAKYKDKETALMTQKNIMGARGKALGIDVSSFTGDEGELTKRLEALIDDVVAKVNKKLGRTNLSIADVLAMKTKDAELKKYIKLLEDLYKEDTDIKLKRVEDKVRKEITKMSEDLSRTEEAKDFWNNILGMTGNKAFATEMTLSIYGEDGKNLDKSIQDQLTKAFKNADIRNIADSDARKAFRNMYGSDEDIVSRTGMAIVQKDWLTLRKMMEILPEDWKDVVANIVDSGIKANADWLKDMEQTYRDAKTYAEREEQVRAKSALAIEQINDRAKRGQISSDYAETLSKAVIKKETQEIADIEVEAMKNTELWAKSFENVERIGASTLDQLIRMTEELIDKQGAAMSPEAKRALSRELEQLYKEKEKRSPLSSFVEGLSEMTTGQNAIRALRKEMRGLDKDSEQYIADEAALIELQDQSRKGFDKMRDAIQNAQDNLSSLSSALSSVIEIFGELGGRDDSGASAALQGIADGLKVITTGLVLLAGVMTVIEMKAKILETNPVISGLAATAATLILITTTLNSIKTNRANHEIKKQERVLKDLEAAYSRLSDQQDKVFGSKYIEAYNARLAVLQAKIDAYQKQANAEASKGKKADKDKVQDYKDQIAEVEIEIEKAQTELSEYFSGSSLASAAEDFASAWIDAYKEFGSTTDAIEEKFEDMVQNMVVKSFAAQIVQNLLSPLFDQLDEAKEAGDLTAGKIAEIAAQVPQYVSQINSALAVSMSELANAGYNIRTSSVGLKGISKDIAQASEESILGLAAGINTQNFYISGIYASVNQILAVLTGGDATSIASRSAAANVQSAVSTSDYFSYLPTIADNTAQTVRECQNVLAELKKVIVPKSSSGNGYRVITN